MACQATQSWTFSSLVGAYLDLAITYLLLCASALAFFTSKFLSFFGLHLPCPCNGLFCDPNSRNCVHRFLFESPIRRISSVQMSCKSKFPIDSILMENHQGRRLNLKLLREDSHDDREGEASCSSLSSGRLCKKNELVRFESGNPSGRKGLDETRGRGALNPRLRRRRRAGVDGNRRIGRESSQSPFGSGRIEHEIVEDEASSVQFDSGRDGGQHDKEASVGIQSDGSIQHSFQWNDLMGESKILERNESSASDIVRSVLHDVGSDVNAIRVLEQALEEEHAARSALYQELEKERSAAASAADEAMAMILRLQKEKAATQMEARQYQRMIEEKSAYDAEEMNILKEILVRREKEKHFLEKEVETYRQMLAPGNEESAGMSTPRPRTTFDPSEDPSLMLQQISAYIDKKEMVKNMNSSSDHDATSVEKHGRVLSFGEESPSPCWPEMGDLLTQEEGSVRNENQYPNGPRKLDDCEQGFQEKQLQSMEEHPSGVLDPAVMEEADSSFYKLNMDQEQNSLEKTIVIDDEQRKSENDVKCKETLAENDQICESGVDNYNSSFEAEPTLLDVHVVDDKSKLCDQGSKEEPADRCTKFNIQSDTSSLRSGLPSTSRGGTPPLVRRSVSDMRTVLDKSQGKDLLSDMRRYSMSSVNLERLKLENEVGWLRERLKLVQEGREKLSFSVEHREREKLHLQLLDDIARQLRDIRQLTEPGNVRQGSLPPPSKISSKKRRCRSASLQIHGSS